jgi:protein ImuB
MRAADARGLRADLREWAWDPDLYDEVQTGLAASLLAASPRVGRAGTGAFWLDAGGWGRRGGEAAFVQTVRSAADAAGYPEARVGIADTAVAARAATRLRGRTVRRVPPGRDARFLAPLPIRALPLSEDLLDLLEALGLETAGALAALEPAEVEGRLGSEGLRAHRLARGLDDGRERPGGERAAADRTVEVELPGPTESLEPLLFLLKSCLDRLSEELGSEGLCAAALRWSIETENGGPVEGTIRPPRPSRRPGFLLGLCRDALEGLRLPGRALGVRIEVEEAAPGAAEQIDLFESPGPDPEALAVTLHRLRRRWGRESVVRPTAADSHRPEGAGRWEPVGLDAGSGGTPAGSSGEPVASGSDLLTPILRLWSRPRPIAVRIEDGRPGAVSVDGGWRGVRALLGPERLSGDWWQDPYRREYYRLVTEPGDLLWVFYEPGRGEWFWHGWWD